MANKINAIMPDPPISGASLYKESVAGRKARFVFDSTQGATSFTLAAGGNLGVALTLGLWPPELPNISRTSANIIPFRDAIAWPFEDIYVDNDMNTDYLLLTGNLITTGQRLVKMSRYASMVQDAYVPGIGNTATFRYRVYNDDSISHTIYFYARAKYIIFGDYSI